jgi:hypothetical protein
VPGEALPPLSPTAGALLAGLILVVWVALRVGVVRRREAQREEGEPDVSAWGWLRALARSDATNAVLAILGLAFLAAFVWTVSKG